MLELLATNLKKVSYPIFKNSEIGSYKATIPTILKS
jgi:hypothetical protein